MYPEILSSALGIEIQRARDWAEPISAAMSLWGIDNANRISSFLAQIGHESGGLLYVKEIWGPTAAQMRYDSRKDLGNTGPGDGKKFMGRGLIQITGRINYAKAGAALGLPLIDAPELLEEATNAALSAAWFWCSNGLNELADSGEFISITKKINGGTNGISNRLALLKSAQAALSAGGIK